MEWTMIAVISRSLNALITPRDTLSHNLASVSMEKPIRGAREEQGVTVYEVEFDADEGDRPLAWVSGPATRKR
jgi:hypothetical protein